MSETDPEDRIFAVKSLYQLNGCFRVLRISRSVGKEYSVRPQRIDRLRLCIPGKYRDPTAQLIQRRTIFSFIPQSIAAT